MASIRLLLTRLGAVELKELSGKLYLRFPPVTAQEAGGGGPEPGSNQQGA